jgi:hypothetical protein
VKGLLYDTSDLMEQASISRQQVSYWMLNGWITPHEGGGQGFPLLWSHSTVRHACLMAKVVRAGVAPDVASKVADRGRYTDGDVTITLNRKGVTR